MVTATGNIRSVRIEEEMRSSYLDYAMSVIVSRALPDVRDGLKPVQRRILYAMDELGMRPNTPFRKSARLVGEVLGKYHPHGDTAVYDALVRMAQDFTLRYPLVDGQGNFGSVDDDPPAAMRYTESRLTAIAQEMLADIDRDTVDFGPNFDDSLEEPLVLPARLPNLLVNGASGIAVGMATNIPPHNLREVCDAVVHLVDRPEATSEDLATFVQGPDFPTGGIILGRDGILSAYSTGRGRVVVRARAEIEEMGRGNREQIVVTELPYQVNKAALVEKIAQLAKDKKIDGISDVRDESDRKGLRVVVELRRDAQAQVVLNNLFKHTALQSAFFINALALVDGQPQVLPLKRILRSYIDFRRQVITRRAQYDLEKAQERAHILEGLRMALANLEAVINLIRQSANADAARQGLMEQFSLTQVQAQAVLDMQLRRIAALERERIEEEYQALQKTIGELEALLADPQKVLAEVKQETRKLRKDYGDDRRTEIWDEEAKAHTNEELIPHQEMVITLTQRGYIKRMPSSTYKAQHRGGRGIIGMATREADLLQHLLVADTHDTLLFFTNLGKVYSLKCYELPQDANRSTRGLSIVNLLSVTQGERVNAIVRTDNAYQEGYILLATRKGEIKRMSFSSLANIRSNGLIAMDLEPEDEVVSAWRAQELDEVVMVTEGGMAARFPVSDVRVSSRTAGGVRGIRLEPSDRVVSMDVVLQGAQLLVLSRNGFGKLTPIQAYRRTARGAKGVRTLRITDKTGPVVAAHLVMGTTELMLVSEKGNIIRMPISDIPVKGRYTQGVWIMRPGEEDHVVTVTSMNGHVDG
ncbi:MAG: DNA gyrase subunit A [Chloroflexi bacterium]|nr:DNA gyrase subunit A [Chloroflexota bacterium]